jgi:adenylyltransferase/sulfurtransferase
MDERYSRQIIIPEIGKRSRHGSAMPRFGGRIGGHRIAVLFYLEPQSGHPGVADSDKVSLSNLNRQILYTTED